MNYLRTLAFCFCLWVNTCFAFSILPTPDQFLIAQNWISLTTNFTIISDKQNLATLYRQLFRLVLTYNLFDEQNNRVAIARARFFPFNVRFNIFDNNRVFLGRAIEQLFVFFPSFTIYGRNRSARIAVGKMNFWGTKIFLLDPGSNTEFAVMTRPFIRTNNDWTLVITNKSLFERRTNDARVFMTVVALQGDREFWETSGVRANQSESIRLENLTDIDEPYDPLRVDDVGIDKINDTLVRLNIIGRQLGLTKMKRPDPQVLEAIANEVETNFINTQFPDDRILPDIERFNNFTNYCFNLIAADSTPFSQKQIIFYLLRLRLQIGLI